MDPGLQTGGAYGYPAPSVDPVPGYGGYAFDNTPLAPPPVGPDPYGPEPLDRGQVQGPQEITQEEAKAALLELCNQNCCYGKTAATGSTIQSMTSSSAYHYSLETFTETRSTEWAQVPFVGGNQSVDTAANGPAPLPWDIPVTATEKFKAEKKQVEVPHTASVKACHVCTGTGEQKCEKCKQTGQISCTSCSGQGKHEEGTETKPCAACNGVGHKPCTDCSGKGVKQCGPCKGHKQLKWFIQLTVNWTNHKEDFVHQTKASLPENIVRNATGQTAFQEENPWVFPISQCPEQAINKASLDLVTKHRTAFAKERLLLQRQTVRIIPVTEVKSQWETKQFTYYVYGLNRQAYSSDYPQQYCCGLCVIL